MFLARVSGTVVSTVKDGGLHAYKLLTVEPLDEHGAALRQSLVAVDAVGAGVGEIVYCCRGKEAGLACFPPLVPTDAAIVGILDPAANAALLPAQLRSAQ